MTLQALERPSRNASLPGPRPVTRGSPVTSFSCASPMGYCMLCPFATHFKEDPEVFPSWPIFSLNLWTASRSLDLFLEETLE